jgi:hypothetical protein
MEGRKRGGQTGNTNSLKHGFYSRKFRVMEKGDLDEKIDADQIKEDVLLLRAVIRRVWEFSSDEAKDLDRWISTLNVLGLAITRQSRVLWLQSQMEKTGGSDAARAVSDAIKRMLDDFKGSK